MNTFAMLSDDARRQILELLRDGERQVNDIVRELDIHQSGVSRHLHILLNGGFVKVRRDGQRRLYSLRAGRFREVQEWIDAFRRLWDERLDRFGEALDENRRESTNDREEDVQ